MKNPEKLFNVFIHNYRTDTVFVSSYEGVPEELSEENAVELIVKLADNELTVISVMNAESTAEGLIAIGDYNREHFDFVASVITKE